MKKILLFIAFIAITNCFAQTDKLWKSHKGTIETTSKNVKRPSFPKDFQLYQLNIASMKQILSHAQDRFVSKKGVVISLPNTQGKLEQFEVFEASNFTPELQAQFPDIRAYAGRSLEDKYAQLRMSISSQGIQTMIFRTESGNEFMEPYSADGSVYAVYNSSRNKGDNSFTCSTVDEKLVNDLSGKTSDLARSGAGKLLTFRLAMSCTGEYATYHGGTQALVLAAFNNTITRVNGVYEKDLGIHMNLIASTTNVIYLNSGTDPYGATDANYNAELQAALTAQIGEGNYDIGHLVSATGGITGNGNAGCIGCVCVNGQKGSGFTTRSIPVGDDFDIDFVAHEMGHQFGGNHTFSNNNEGYGVNVEVGSGVTIMGYAGITPYDTHLHSIDLFHAGNIAQIQANMLTKTCQTETILTHGAPVVNAGTDYTIPKSTPFMLTGSATDSNNDALNYAWEQNDDGVGQTAANSGARANKPTGPNWVNYVPSTIPSRYFPRLSSVIANQSTTAGLDVVAEALSSVVRTLTFRLTARDNNILGGQTGFDNAVITVNATAGPFLVSIPNTNVSWAPGSNQTVTWTVAGTTANGVNAAYVDIYLSTDGGNTYPVLLAGKVPNDGSETVTIPNSAGTTNRIMIKGNNHIFFDISDINFTIAAPASTFALAFSGVADGQFKATCQGTDSVYDLNYSTIAGFSGNTTFGVTGNPAGSIVTFSPTSINTTGTVNATISNTISCAPGLYTMTVTGTSGATTKTVKLYLEVLNAGFAVMSLTSPANLAVAQPTNPNLSWVADATATSYDVQVATDDAFSNIIVNGNVATNSYLLSGLTPATNYFWKVLPKNAGCSGVYSSSYRFTTGTLGAPVCNNFASTNIPLTISASGTPTVDSTITIPGGSNVTISDLNITAQITHSYTSDLTITLISPTGIQVQLVTGMCTSNNNINATFDDAGATLVCGTNPAISGTIIPAQALSAFNGEFSQGVWTLRVYDGFNTDGGSITNWSLNICNNTFLPTTCGQIATTWNGSAWSNGKPLDNVATTINGNYTSTGDLEACSLNVAGTAQMTVLSGHNLTVAGVVNVAGTANLTIENNANLIQTQNVSNIGNIIVKRTTASLMRQDYVLWSSPVVGQQLQSFSPFTLATRFYTYNPSTNLYVTVGTPAATNFAAGTGYLIRMPNDHPATPTIWNGTFTGIPNNGTVNLVVTNGSYNAIGNPYPSTIDADLFISANGIAEALYFWRKTNNAATTSYATYTLAGGAGTGSNSGDPLGLVPNGIIQVGQGFIAKSTATTLSFTNPMRLADNGNQFLRTTANKSRVWLNLTNTNGLFSQTMVAYMPNATQGVDAAIDGRFFNDSQTALTSIINNEEFAVQGRALPFDASDVVPLGFKTELAGNYTIALDHFDGLFTLNQDVFLRDNMNNTIQDLKAGSYTFATAAGVFNSRFEIIYQNLLDVNLPVFDENSVVVYKNNGSVYISSGAVIIDNVKIFDISGRLLTEKQEVNSTATTINTSKFATQVLIVQITSNTQIKISKKVVN
ncbi:reprolysin-like metallopeptidase [Flavobacterium sp.]|uniref:reprolysin-like metallopeptidase n=1 Tax=Flavobacterium sp. TaxID=239 RepID=UPI002B4B78A2|nr:zinc-dependent metalloprotease family protein [Flavobacterium sp.]HLF52743.1 zinc-dependent metalloprotease family protein [Flavobacterium sp.]